MDKTQYLAQLVTSGFKCVFLSRPHRFGKSLFLSTFQSYFEGKKELFDGLYIAQVEEKIAQEQKREPWEASHVLYFDFNAKDYLSPNTLRDRFALQFALWESKYGIEKRYDAPDARFIHLIRTLYEKENKQVVILNYDEYDKSLLETVTQEDLNETNRSLLKGFYEVLKQCDSYIRFAFLTGITKLAKTTLFNGVNNLVVLADGMLAISGLGRRRECDKRLAQRCECNASEGEQPSVKINLHTKVRRGCR